MRARRNVELVRSIYDAWARGDPAIELFHPDVQWSTPHPGAHVRGRDEVRGFLRSYMGAWEERVGLEQMRAIGDDRVLALFTEAARGRSSGVETVIKPATLWTLRDSLVMHFEAVDRRMIARARVRARRLAGARPSGRDTAAADRRTSPPPTGVVGA